ncbi:MAG: GTP cyclohydrolase I [Candidatus Poseidoniia archaeon]|nr:GTP cyclohydrolase I [Candidatus Poseidoniia archaeon]MDP6658434.1 GTP cyclohydrolase I [Candidatus Poseidoniia archaeon]MDP6834752.1 GTP cyclohydrolase I [Candidatus Poseidoniia archaeon]MDP7007643.1 GTP cyclohydrolase I [Candidatus Poseidoniia archaeon]
MDRKALEQAVADFLKATGVPPEEHHPETPVLVAEAWEQELLAGYAQSPAEALGEPIGSAEEELVLLKGVEFHSMCAHHLLPFRGTTHVGYLPGPSGIVGIGALARLVECFARRLQTQERLTAQIVDALETHLAPKGTAVVIEADHACMQARGPRSAATTITSQFRGELQARSGEFLTLAGVGDGD